VRHSVNELPFGSGKRWKLSRVSDALLGGWQMGGIINTRTGVLVDMRVGSSAFELLFRHAVWLI